MKPAFLDDRAVIAISGPEARDFLQGLVTNDIKRGLAPGQGLYTALLSPQGKILFDFLVAEGDGTLFLDVAGQAVDALAKKLKIYKLRANVEIKACPELGVFVNLKPAPAIGPSPDAGGAVSFADPRVSELGIRSIALKADMPDNLAGSHQYHQARIALGVPEGSDFGYEKVFALDAGLEELHGVSFNKGCYIGQELTSRMKHRASSRKRILSVCADVPLPDVGTSITRDGIEIGELLSHYDQRGFGLVRLDRLEETQGVTRAGEIIIALTRPAWLDAKHGQ